MKKLASILVLVVIGLSFGCVKEDPQASLAIQIVKNSSITRLGFGMTVEQYCISINCDTWKAEKKAEDTYVVTVTGSNNNYAEWEVNVRTQDIAWPKVGVIKNGQKIRLL